MKATDFEYEDMLYWCPEEVYTHGLLNQPLKKRSSEATEIWFWFVCFKDGECKVVSKIIWYAAMYRALMAGKIDSVNIKPTLTPEAITHIRKHLQTL